ncbi:hypothetical protein L1887_59229 [Cichorium endivia]|nr:hypothetical protein L1887_59229 [Cichorium endivia]
MALPSLAAGADAGRPATSSVSIDGAIISGTEVATLDHSLDTIADVLAAHDAEQAASPYVPRSPAPPAISGSSSPVVDRSRSAASSAVRQPLHHPGMGAAAARRAAARHLPCTAACAAYGHADASAGPQYDAFTSQPSIMQQLGGGAGMSRSVSTSAAASPRIGGLELGPTSGSSATRGRCDEQRRVYACTWTSRLPRETRRSANRLDSLQLATSTAAATAAEAKTRKAA